MSGWLMIWKKRTGPAPTDGSVFRPDQLLSQSIDQVRDTPVRVGRTYVSLGELVSIEPTDADVVELVGAPALNAFGAGMTGGELRIRGKVGDDLGTSMSGGLIHVHGGAGHRVGGPAADANKGMTGGEIVIDGDAGNYVGMRMRRGMIIVKGHAGASPGYRMIAGTIVLCLGPVDHPGLEMRRGTIMCTNPGADVTLGVNFSRDRVLELSSMTFGLVMVRRLRDLCVLGSDRPNAYDRVRIWTGDRCELNKGEVWQWVC